jgi:hypothetical protein
LGGESLRKCLSVENSQTAYWEWEEALEWEEKQIGSALPQQKCITAQRGFAARTGLPQPLRGFAMTDK